MSLASRLFNPMLSNNFSASCAFVSVGVSKDSNEISMDQSYQIRIRSSSGTQARTRIGDQLLHHGLTGKFNLLFG